METTDTATAIQPGARVRSADGYIGAVERLERSGSANSQAPDHMIVRSDDQRWRYSIPLALVTDVQGARASGKATKAAKKGAQQSVVLLDLPANALPQYAVEETPEYRTSARGVTAADQVAADTITVPVREEELIAGTRPVQFGSVHIHRGVETREAAVQVPVRHDEVIVEHLSPDQYDGAAPSDPNEMIIPLMEERLVVQKQRVVREYLRVRKQTVQETREVRDTVRRETVEVVPSQGLEEAPEDANSAPAQ